MESEQKQMDHDLLIELKQEFRSFKEELKEKLAELKESFKDRVDDHEKRLRLVERVAYGGLAILGAIQFYLGVFK